MPLLLHDFLEMQTRVLREAEQALAPVAAASRGRSGRGGGKGGGKGGKASGAGPDAADRPLRWTIIGASLVLSAALLGAAQTLAGGADVSSWTWVLGVVGIAALVKGVFD